MHVEPQKEHQWLQRLVGDWTFETEILMSPDQPPEKCHGTESVRSIGDVWVQGEGRGEMPGAGIGITQMTLGYDPAKGRFVGTFIGSMMTNLWVYEGSLDEATNTLTLETTGPSFTELGKQIPYRDMIELKDNGERILTSSVRGEDGSWQRIMTAIYRRTK